MDRQRWLRAKEIFDAASALQAEARQEHLDSSCGDDSELRAEVEHLLALHDRSDGILAADPITEPIPAPAFAPGQVVASRFEIIRLLGRGGMGEVYEARDLKLGGSVALKTILPELTNNPQIRSRFRREILTARRVSHQNICKVFDLAPDEAHPDTLIFTMELLAGENLATILKRRGRFTVQEALPLVRQMAAGLEALHQEGITHRDFKPGNIVLDQTDPERTLLKITDFGLARPTALAEGYTTGVSRSQGLVGTPAYMAPEQLTDRKTSHGSDIYALGLVIYEMVTGTRPYDAESVGANAVSKNSGPPPSPRERVPELDRRWERTILQCLEPDPENRPANAAAVLAGLEGPPVPLPEPVRKPVIEAFFHPTEVQLRIFAVCYLLLLAIVGYTVIRPDDGLPSGAVSRAAIPMEKHVAVLPFQNVGGDPESQAFCDGLVEMITSILTQLQDFQGPLSVVPASEIRGSGITTAAQAHQEFQVNLVITGSVQRFGDHFVLTINLVDAGSRRQLRSATEKVELSDLSAGQTRIIARITELLELEIGVQAERMLRAAETNVSRAYELCLEGRGYLRFYDREGNIDRAIKAFSDAHSLDDSYAPALAGLAEAQYRKYGQVKDKVLLETARENALRAVKLNPMLAATRVTLGLIRQATGDYDEAIEEFKAAVAVSPYDADAHRELANAYRDSGRAEEAEQAYRSAISLRPRDWRFHNSLGAFYFRYGRYEEAEAELKEVVRLAPNNNRGYRNLGALYLNMDRFDEAYSQLQKALEIQPTAKIYDNIGTVMFYQGRYKESGDAFRQAIAEGETSYRTWGNLADALRWTPGQEAEALNAYRQAIELGLEELRSRPNDGGVLVRIAAYEAKSGNCQAALGRIETVADRDWSDLSIRAKSVTVFELCDRRADALEATEIALTAGYSLALIEKNPELARLVEDSRYQVIVAGLERNGSGSTGAR